MYLQTEAIVLTKNDNLETNRGYSLYTKDYGKLRCLVVGAKRVKSKLAANLEPPVISQLQLAIGRQNYIISAASLVSFPYLRQSLAKIVYAVYAFELYDQLVKERQADQKLYHLLKTYLTDLNSFTTDEVNSLEELRQIRLWFLINFLAFLGYSPAARFHHEAISQSFLVLEGQDWRQSDFTKLNLTQLNSRLQIILNHILDRPLVSEQIIKQTKFMLNHNQHFKQSINF